MDRRWRSIAAVFVALTLTISTAPTALAANQQFPDPALRACIQRNLAAQGLTDDHAADLSRLACSAGADGVIENLTGIEDLTALTRLALTGHHVADLDPIGTLPALTALALELASDADMGFLTQTRVTELVLLASGNRLPDLPALNLDTLKLGGSQLQRLDGLASVTTDDLYVLNGAVVDVSGVAGATATRVWMQQLGDNPDLTGLASINGMQKLALGASGLTNLSGLAGHSSLRELQVSSPDLVDISALATIPTLQSLRATAPALTTLGPSGGLSHLNELFVGSAQIASLEALTGATSLMDVDLSHNQITDITPLTDLPDNATLDLTGNRIADFASLSGWSGQLSARDQAIELADAVADTSFALPFQLRDASGADLLPTSLDHAIYANGQLHHGPATAASDLRYFKFSDELVSANARITVFLHQRVTAAELAVLAPTFTGTPQVGVRFTPTLGAWSPSPDEVSYQWFVMSEPIAGATEASYVPTAAEIDLRLRLRVSGRKAGHLPVQVMSSYSDVVVGAPLTMTPAPTITATGPIATDTVLAAVPGIWDSGVTLHYQWQHDGSNIPGATDPSYRVEPFDIGGSIRVKVTGSAPGHMAVTRYSNAMIPTTATFAAIPPAITGKPSVGQQLQATVSWPAGTSLSYRWYRNGRAIKHITTSSYRLTASDLGSRLKVKVTARKWGYAGTALTSASSKKIVKGTIATQPVQVEGEMKPGRRLTASHGIWAGGGVRYSYRWYRDGRPLRGATAKTYKLKLADAGHKISVRVSGSRYGHTTAHQTSIAAQVG